VVRIPLTIFGYSLRCVINNYPRIPTTGQTLVTSWRGHLGRLETKRIQRIVQAVGETVFPES
jgi:hypothetical protein